MDASCVTAALLLSICAIAIGKQLFCCWRLKRVHCLHFIVVGLNVRFLTAASSFVARGVNCEVFCRLIEFARDSRIDSGCLVPGKAN